MSVAIIDEWPLGDDADDILRSAARYADHVRLKCPWVQLSLWLGLSENPLKLLQIRVFDRYSDYLNDSSSGLMDTGLTGKSAGDGASHATSRATPIECEVFRSTGGAIEEVGPDEATENIVGVVEWTFRRDADQARALAVMDDYFRHLKRRRHSLLFSVWLRRKNDPMQFAQFSVFKRPAALEKERTSESFNQFLQGLRGLVEEEPRLFSARVIVSSRAALSKVGPGRGRRRTHPVTWAPAVGA